MRNTARQQLSYWIARLNHAQDQINSLVGPAVIERARELAPDARELVLEVNGPDEFYVSGMVNGEGVKVGTQEDWDDGHLGSLVSSLHSENVKYDRTTGDWRLAIPAL